MSFLHQLVAISAITARFQFKRRRDGNAERADAYLILECYVR
ncbi:hypothetical protein [Rhodoferax sp.]